MRIAIIYDCLYPHTIGGAERWYRNLATRLAARHEVTYLTRRQWPVGIEPDAPPGVRLVVLGPRGALYTPSGRRGIGPPLRFGFDVLTHLLRNRRAYDVVHTCSFPYFPLLAAAALSRLGGPPVVTDWIEVWPPDYWRTYLGRSFGWSGVLIQRLCISLTDQAFTFAPTTAALLGRCGYPREPVMLRGMFAEDGAPPEVETGRAPLVVYIGRHIREKHVTAIPPAIAMARRSLPELRAVIFGDGPERHELLAAITHEGLQGSIECPGFVDWSVIDQTLRQAACLILPSEREGYGLVVLEAAARGTPAVVVRGANNAAADLVEDGVSGYVAADAGLTTLADAICKVIRNGVAMRRSTVERFRELQATFSIDSSLPAIEHAYRVAAGGSTASRT